MLQPLHGWWLVHTCIIKCATVTSWMVVGAHLHYKVCYSHFMNGGWCTPHHNWCAVFLQAGVYGTPSSVLCTQTTKTLPGVLYKNLVCSSHLCVLPTSFLRVILQPIRIPSFIMCMHMIKEGILIGCKIIHTRVPKS